MEAVQIFLYIVVPLIAALVSVVGVLTWALRFTMRNNEKMRKEFTNTINNHMSDFSKSIGGLTEAIKELRYEFKSENHYYHR